ncbi:MAG: response regulator [Pseudomonadota bacterium]|nr:response regulator [Pseudomonadota bacterium]
MQGTLLVVDDDDDVRHVVTEFLTARGYRVEAVASGQAALALLARERFDLAVVDWTLPDMPDGALLRILGERWPACGVLVITGQHLDDLGDVLPAALDGRLVQKPFSLRELAARIEKELAKSPQGG